jgi:hypothetical protein
MVGEIIGKEPLMVLKVFCCVFYLNLIEQNYQEVKVKNQTRNRPKKSSEVLITLMVYSITAFKPNLNS